VFAGCGDDDRKAAGPSSSDAPAAPKGTPSADSIASISGAGHVHGLAVNPAGGDLLIATHNGLYELAPGAAEAEPVGDSRDDFMGFTVIGADSYLTSGHPGPGSDRPDPLGLQVSSDGGVSWQSRSLLGEADLHVLRAAGTRVYGVDSSSGAFLVSADSGRSWQQRELPAPAIDLAIAPDDPERLVVATQDGLYGSVDAGSNWRLLAADRIGLLTWPATGSLLMVDAAGKVMASSDGGEQFEAAGTIGAPPEAFGSGDGRVLAAAGGGRVLASDDGGSTWATVVEPE
jgi:photosystem II stability/assembly factor-like uncharacterized protein